MNPARLKLVFAGTPAFAAAALSALIDAGHTIALVLTQPDRPSGRGLQVHPSPVKALATAHGIPVAQPMGLRIGGRHDRDARDAHDRLAATPHDAMIVAAYGLILPASVLDLPPRGCLNVHASLLPRWRGAAPVQRAIEAGDTETGITIMRMDEGLDTGPILATHRTPIHASDTGGSLTARLAALGGSAIVEALAALEAGTLVARPQHRPDDESAVTYAAKLSKSDARLDFRASTRTLVDRIRAFDPWPGCVATRVDAAGGEPVVFKIWSAKAVLPAVAAAMSADDATPGTVIGWRDDDDDGAVVVVTADGAIALTALQRPGGKRLAARTFAREFGAGRRWRFDAPD